MRLPSRGIAVTPWVAPRIHGLRGTGILLRLVGGHSVDQIANDIGMTIQTVERYMRFRDQVGRRSGPAAGRSWRKRGRLMAAPFLRSSVAAVSYYLLPPRTKQNRRDFLVADSRRCSGWRYATPPLSTCPAWAET